MSVLLGDRKESKFEAITYSIELHDNCASIKGRGISQQRKRFEIHLHKYYQLYGNDDYILFGDFSKFYDNIIHEIAKRELLKLFDDDEFIDWLLTLIFKGFQIDVSYMSDEEYEACMTDTFNKLEYRNIPKREAHWRKVDGEVCQYWRPAFASHWNLLSVSH